MHSLAECIVNGKIGKKEPSSCSACFAIGLKRNYQQSLFNNLLQYFINLVKFLDYLNIHPAANFSTCQCILSNKRDVNLGAQLSKLS